MNYLFYNEKAFAGKLKENVPAIKEELSKTFSPDIKEVSLNECDILAFLKTLTNKDSIILIGGDGTLNHQINILPVDEEMPCPIYLYPFGTGNDFLNDVKDKQDSKTKLVKLNDYLKNLPYVEVKGKTYRFINGIGYGIDGECCKKAEELKKQGKKDLNYGKITIGLLFKGYVPPIAKVKVDGKEELIFKKTYISAAMNGKYYGGGMMVAPSQERGSNLLTSVVMHGKGKLGTLMMFPSIFKGKHVLKKKNVSVIQGKVIEVSFSKPTALQIDGEVIPDVSSYKAYIK